MTNYDLEMAESVIAARELEIERLTADLFAANLKAMTFEEGYDETGLRGVRDILTTECGHIDEWRQADKEIADRADDGADEIERLTFVEKNHLQGIAMLEADNERLRAALERINQWCKAYPRTVFIEPTDEQWEWANQVLDADPGCPSLTAISGSNMRHVVEGIQALAATEQEGET